MNSGVFANQLTEVRVANIIKYEDISSYQIKNSDELKGKNLVNYIKGIEKKK